LQEILVVGLGPGSFAQLSLGVWQALREGNPVYLRTAKHPVVEELAARGIEFQTFDNLYEEKANFAEVYESIAETLFSKMKSDTSLNRLVYAVPGHPLVGETTVKLLLERAGAEAGVKVTILAGMSFVDSLLNLLKVDLTSGFTILDALDFGKEELHLSHHQIFTQVYNRFVSSELKLTLLEVYPPEHLVTVIRAAGIPEQEQKVEVRLSELDHLTWFDHLTSVYVPPLNPQKAQQELRQEIRQETQAIQDTQAVQVTQVTQDTSANTQGLQLGKYPLDPLVAVLERLLGPEGCPWDKEQTHFTLKSCLLEETYEVLEAIDSEDMNNLKEELGDVLLQVVFHTALAEQRGDFNLNDVVREITEKMVRRHPHVFGKVVVKNSAEVLKNWEEIKKAEKGNKITN
jgi:tetrapyrrole methylase family protein/MazG family protein